MEVQLLDDLKDILERFPLLSGFDTYYLGFFHFSATPKLSLEEIVHAIYNIVELYQNETITEQDKIKSFVRVLSKRLNPEYLSELDLKIERDDEGRIPLKDYFSQIMEILQKENINETRSELFFLGRFHAEHPLFKIADFIKLAKQFSSEKDSLQTFLELLEDTSLTYKINQASTTEVTKNRGINDESKEIENTNKGKNHMKRRGDSSIFEENELKKMRKTPNDSQKFSEVHENSTTMASPSSLSMIIEENKKDGNKSDKNGNGIIKKDSQGSENNPFSDLMYDLEEIVPKLNNNKNQTDNNDIPPEVLKFVEMEKNQFELKRMQTNEEEELSRALIEQVLKEEENARAKAAEKLEQQNTANCSICLDDLYSTTFKPLEGCPHVFHEECMREYLKSKIDEKGFPIICPEIECKSEIRLNDVADFMDKEYQEKFESFSFKSYLEKNAAEISCCPTADCPFAFVKEEDQTQLMCPVCNKHYCLNCRVVWHKGMSCKEFEVSNKRDENDVKFEKFIKGQKYKQCPKCNFWVSRTEGCNAMTCRCGTMFCYNCGKEGDGHVCPCLTQGRQRGGGVQPLNLIQPAGGLFANPQPAPVQWRPVNNFGGGGLFGGGLLANNNNPYYNNYNNVLGGGGGGLFGTPLYNNNNLFANRVNYLNNGYGGGGLYGNNGYLRNPNLPAPLINNPGNLFANNNAQNPNYNQHLVGEEPEDADSINSDSDRSVDEAPIQRKKKKKNKKRNHPNALL